MLWQLALDWMVARVDDLTQPWNRARAIGWMMELYAVGERPPPAELAAYLRAQHPNWAPTRKVIDTWSKLMRDPMYRFRLPRECRKYQFRQWPYQMTGDLIIDHRLPDSLESRVQRFVLSAADAYARLSRPSWKFVAAVR